MNGFILVNKESGVTSNSIVQQIKKTIKAKKVGHLGTLDPLASGLLILAVNRATKFSSYFLESDKTYDVQFELGTSTDTEDSTGNIIYQSNRLPKKSEVKKILDNLIGDSMQIPPFFSALKHKGKPLYEYARKGEFITKPSRRITIKSIKNFNMNEKICSFRIHCSKGTYIRSIGRDLGNHFECGAHMRSLKRLSQGNFFLNQANIASEIEIENIINIDDAFSDFKKIIIDGEDLKKFINGVKVLDKSSESNLLRVFCKSGNFLGIGKIKNNFLQHKQLV
ncbi:MAG: tRNA pseudouridine(55) synthase TruB [SAR86 cluster bacterium]|uniref:tRNA pseudouridine synthase B n=1 Tax=SAR86 cluster bacterium TaxID=2030880 RepID=A0A520N1X8_9GAMM|nr:MAG: tRNA pseudouridine(55) synthase TruB [SAR86 cluster bacterium]|tara:strand:+ start:53 stop:892 length:840 start_codon:yes stop_codon:yes gene_type:complete